MTASPLNRNLNESNQLIPEINLVATIKLTPEHFIQSHQLKFVSGQDDLDSLIFTSLDLLSGSTISLVRHQNAPYFGTELYISPSLSDPSKVLTEALNLLQISKSDLDWIHPQIHLVNLV